MKKTLLFILIAIVHIQCSAQNRLSVGEKRGKRETFIVSDIGKFGSFDNISVSSKNNRYNNGTPRIKDPRALPMDFATDVHVDNSKIKAVVYNVLTNKLDALKSNKETLIVLLVFRTDGVLSDVTFGLHKNTIITTGEIEEIDSELRQTIKASYNGKQYLNYEAINYGRMPRIDF